MKRVPKILAGSLLLPLLCIGIEKDKNPLQARLKTRLTSYQAKPGLPFECTVIAPWINDDRVVIPMGATIHGHVERVHSVGLGVVHERAQLDLAFDDFVTPGGQRFPLRAQLANIDNAREQVKKGGVRGVLAAKHPNQLLLGIWHDPSPELFSRSLIGLTGVAHQVSELISSGPLGAGSVLALRFALFRFPEPEIQLPPGTDFALKVDAAHQEGIGDLPELPTPASEAMSEWLRTEPFTVDRRDNNKPIADIVNVALLGSREQIVNAFAAAGWSQADERRSYSKMFSAYSSMRAYATAPVSALLYKGMLPGFVFQKSFNTINMRHHIRVWYAGVVDGKELWLGAATHDTGLAFNRRHFTFTHKIDQNIDDERDKIATDLSFAGCVDAPMRVERAAAVSNGLSRSDITDGAATVLSLTETCSPNPDFDASAGFRKPGTQASRLLRRLILESRNHMFRENLYYWTFEFAKQQRAARRQP